MIRRALALSIALLLVVLLGLRLTSAADAATASPVLPRSTGEGVAALLRQSHGELVIGGLGSSVGNGATLPDPATQAPVAYFSDALIAATHRPRADVRVVNGSVNGSTIHDGLSRDWPILKRSHPDVVVLAYGMNDGAPLQFNSGETFPGAMADLAALLESIRASGAVPVVLTSPSPDVARVDWTRPISPFIYPPSGVTGLPGQSASSSILQKRVDGRTIQVSARHALVDAGMARVARSLGVDVVDVEPDWYRAVAAYGVSALFNPAEVVHPNLRGHRLSYDRAISTWFALSAWSMRPGPRGFGSR